MKPNTRESVVLISEMKSRGSASGGVANGPALQLAKLMVLKLVHYEPPRAAAFKRLNGHLL